ncbi:hypothetical protein ET475_14155 [Microbacterium protaetiae]|uniref:Glycosyltransferase RgtA/B/C/D-like domain-containing protein n=2 Tax=Microbacterium protaetiae TaxID=2509458 RepID=A0A4P6EV20_9MICO|nr:hypothetical protein ET475_14155 [Microbacterium protaetiae]
MRIAIIYLIGRVITTGLFAGAAQLSTASSRYGERPRLGTLLMGWDAQWYWYIAVHGYPSSLPLDEAGQVTQNQWAFMPVYPYLARLLGGTGIGWQVAAILISLVSGYLAALVLYLLLRPRIGAIASMWAVVFFANAPLAAMFQVAYAESLFLLMLFAALWLVARRRYAWLYPLVLLMAFTRPGALAFALFLALHGIVRWVRRRDERLRPSEVVHIVLNGLLAAIAGFAWPVIAAAVTGRADAYMATELSWRRGWITGDDGSFAPFRGFWDAAAFWFGQWGLGATAGYIALGALVVLIAALLLFGPRVRRLGTDVRLWSASYLLYLFAVFFPQSSVFRLLLPLSPLWGAAAVPRSRTWRCGVLAACVVGQWWWIYNMYALGNTFWQIP